MLTARTRIRQCPVCLATATEHRTAESSGRTIECSDGCGTYTIATRFYTDLKAAWAGSGKLAGQLGNLSRALRTDAISELVTPSRVLAELRDFLACERDENVTDTEVIA